MDKLIREIFNDRVEKGKYNKIDEEIENEIQRIIKQKEEYLPGKEYEHYRDDMYQAALIGKRGGFMDGFRYAVRLMAECFSQKEDSAKS